MLWLAAHWPLIAAGIVVAALVAFPPLATLAFTTRTGRTVLGAALVVGALAWMWTGRYAAGYRAAEADAEKAALVAQGKARMTERRHAIALDVIADRYEKDKRDAQDENDRVRRDLRAARLRLREHWTCPAQPGTGEPDAGAGLREAGAGSLVQIGREADAHVRGLQDALRACQTLNRQGTSQPETP